MRKITISSPAPEVFLGYVPGRPFEVRANCQHSQTTLAIEPGDTLIQADSTVELRYDSHSDRYVGRCLDCGKQYYVLPTTTELANHA